MPKTAYVEITGVTPYSQSRQHEEPRLSKEGWDDYEKRTWRLKCHVNDNDVIYVPQMAFKFCLDSAARFLSIPIEGKGKNLYTKHFLAGVLVPESLLLPDYRGKTVEGEWVWCHANGKRGSGTRVKRKFPTMPRWGGVVQYVVLDDTITKDIFERVVAEAGQFIGVGRFRPENSGFYGRFNVKSIRWEDV